MSYLEIKDKLFQILVKEHLRLKKPIGSKILSQKKFSNLASSTLRLYLSRLVKEGLLETVKSSLGKIPTDNGWYYYFNLAEEKEIELPLSNSLDNALIQISQKFSVISCLLDNSLKLTGLQKFIRENSAEIEVIEEAVSLLEKPKEMIDKISSGVNLLIGNDLKSNLALFVFKNNNLFFGFISHKRIDYPIIWSVFKKCLDKYFNVRATKPTRTAKQSKRHSPRRTPITIN